jgi:hypothetical protein
VNVLETNVHPFPFEHPAYGVYEFNREDDGMDGIQYRFKFGNGYGVSVIRHSFSYGYQDDLWELGVTDHDFNLVYSTPITDDVIGYQNEHEIALLLDAICRLENNS